MDMQKLDALAKECGFSYTAPLRADTIELKEEVRQMCASCHQHGHSWACPPACGSLEECRERVYAYERGILVQTVGDLEDELDGEAMIETQEQHMAHFRAMHEKLLEEYPGLLAISAGTCTLCKDCTYPDAPCRFPEKRTSSMEALGMLVLEVCKKNDLSYYYGPLKIAYTSCFLLQ